MMIFRLCCCCFGFKRQDNEVKNLITKNSTSSTIQKNDEVYTVHKVSSFGRGVSHDDDGAHSDYETTVFDKNHMIVNRNHALWSNRPVHMQSAGDNG